MAPRTIARSGRESTKKEARALRIEKILVEAETRYRHELLDDEERMLLEDRIGRLRRACLAAYLRDDS
jgi:hypothetical protein